MAHRTFTDPQGVAWEVWDTVPDASRRMVQPGYADGWLTFQCDGEKRRLAPIPTGWAELPDGQLTALWSRAAVVPASPSR